MRFVGVWLFTLLLSSCYSIKQAYYQGNELSRKIPIHVLLWNKEGPNLDHLQWSQEVVDFAASQGLSVGSSYRYLVDSSREVASYLVQATKPLDFEAKTWSFPVVGKVPYLGFYHQSDRDEEAQSLIQEGWDVHTSEAEAFSLLGWMADPLFPSMLKRDKAALAHLLFHELTHRTYWYPGSVEFNENLAEWVAIHLTEKILEGEEKIKYRSWIDRRESSSQKVWKLRRELEVIYNDDQRSDADKLRLKAELIAKSGFRASWNNATIMAATLYLPERKSFEQAFQCAGSLPQFFEKLRSKGSLVEVCTNR